MRDREPEHLRWPTLGQYQELHAVGIKQVSRNNYAKVIKQRVSGRPVVPVNGKVFLSTRFFSAAADCIDGLYRDGWTALPLARLNLNRLSGLGEFGRGYHCLDAR